MVDQSSFNGEASSGVGVLCSNLSDWARHPPIEAVIFSWGVGEDGQLGMDSQDDVPQPKVVEALLGRRFRGREFGRGPLVCGSRCTMAIEATGQVLSWGWNARGTLGQGTKHQKEPKPRRVKGLKGVSVVQAAIGGWHAMVLASDGRAYAFGGNEYGQCGCNFDSRDILAPVPVLPELNVRAVACGGMHSLVLTEEGEVWMWGEPWGNFSMTVDRCPRRVEGATNIVQIKCGAFHNLALDSAGQVWSWGINDFGQLGTGDTIYATAPRKVVGLEGICIADVEAGGWHSLAISAQGAVYVWGRGEYGRLGLGERGGASKLRPQRLASLEGHRVVAASAGGTHSMVLTDAGRLFIWGRGSFGRLGTGSDKHAYSPVELSLPGGPDRWKVVDISCGGRHSAALAVPDSGNLRRGMAARGRSWAQAAELSIDDEDGDEDDAYDLVEPMQAVGAGTQAEPYDSDLDKSHSYFRGINHVNEDLSGDDASSALRPRASRHASSSPAGGSSPPFGAAARGGSPSGAASDSAASTPAQQAQPASGMAPGLQPPRLSASQRLVTVTASVTGDSESELEGVHFQRTDTVDSLDGMPSSGAGRHGSFAVAAAMGSPRRHAQLWSNAARDHDLAGPSDD